MNEVFVWIKYHFATFTVKKFLVLTFFIGVVGGVPLAVYMSQQQQDTRQKASSDPYAACATDDASLRYYLGPQGVSWCGDAGYWFCRSDTPDGLGEPPPFEKDGSYPDNFRNAMREWGQKVVAGQVKYFRIRHKSGNYSGPAAAWFMRSDTPASNGRAMDNDSGVIMSVPPLSAREDMWRLIRSGQIVVEGVCGETPPPTAIPPTGIPPTAIPTTTACENQFTNGGFEEGSGTTATGWTVDIGTWQRVGTAFSGSWGMKNVRTNDSESRIKQRLTAKANTAYTVSARVKSIRGLGRVRLQPTGVGSTSLTLTSRYEEGDNPNAAWEYLSGSLTTGSDSNFIDVELYVANPQEIVFDDIRLVEGTACPAPTGTDGPPTGGFTVPLRLPLIGIGVGIGTNQIQRVAPKTATRLVTATVYNASNTVVGTYESILTYDPTDGLFKGNLSVGSTPGTYIIKLTIEKYLIRQIPGIVSLPLTSTLPTVPELIAGDLNGDNNLNIADYEAFRECYDTDTPECLIKDDLNNDGVKNLTDYRIFQEALRVRSGD